MLSAIKESDVIKSTCDCSTDHLTHRFLNEAIKMIDVAGDIVHPTSIDIDNEIDSHLESDIRQDLQPINKSVDPIIKRLKNRRVLNRKKNLPTNDWRMSGAEL